MLTKIPASRQFATQLCFKHRELFNHQVTSKGKNFSLPFFFSLFIPSHIMFAKLTTKIALRKAGIPSNALSFPEYETKGSKDPNAPSPFANPFANLTVPNSLKSWATPPPPPIEVAAAPVLGARAPTSNKLRLPVLDGRPSVVVFLRHCGCPCMLLEICIENKS